MRVSLKLATSLDGRIALADGTSQWITSAPSRARGHALRASRDAILVGAGTARADDPLLTARTTPPPERQPVRIVAASSGGLRSDSRLARSAGVGRVICAVARGDHKALESVGVEIWRCGDAASERVDPAALLARAEVEGLRSVLIEGGGMLAASFLRAGLVDELFWFRAPLLIGGDGLPGVGGLGLADLASAPRWRLAATERIGDDALETYLRA